MEIQVSSDVLAQVTVSEDGFAHRVNEGLRKYTDELGLHLLNVHKWTFTSPASLRTALQTPTAAGDWKNVNKLYWSDLFESIDASRNFFLKRSQPLLHSSVNSLNSGDLISSAPVTRSLLELAIWSLQHSATFKNTLKDYSPQANPALHVMDATGLQDLALKLIWGTRLKERTERNKDVAQMHIIDQFKKVAKRDKLNFIEPTYDFLCELCHPNAVGNWLFADSDATGDVHGQIEVPISPSQNGAEKKNSMTHLCGSICWSALALVNANSQYEEALVWIDRKFELNKLRQ